MLFVRVEVNMFRRVREKQNKTKKRGTKKKQKT